MGNHYKPQKGDPLKGSGEAWQPTPGRHVGRAGVGSPTARGRNKQEITVKNKKQKPGHVTTSVPYRTPRVTLGRAKGPGRRAAGGSASGAREKPGARVGGRVHSSVCEFGDGGWDSVEVVPVPWRNSE